MINNLLKLTHDNTRHQEIKEEIKKEKKVQKSPPMKEKKNLARPRRIWNWAINKKYPKSCKKQKDDKTSGVGGLTNDGYNIIIDRMEEVTNETYKKIDECNTDLVKDIMKLL